MDAAKTRCARILESRWVETFIVGLVLLDVAFVATEAGLDANLLCLGGREVGKDELKSISSAQFAFAQAWPTQAKRGLHPSFLGFSASSGAEEGGAADGTEDEKQQERKEEQVEGLSRTRSSTHNTHDSSNSNKENSSSHSSLGLINTVLSFVSGPHENAHSGGDAAYLLCEGPGSHSVQHLQHLCHVLSVAILVLFALELLLRWWVVPDFLTHPLHKLDVGLVSLSLFFDTVVVSFIESMDESSETSRQQRERIDVVTGLLILLRAWRLVRIAHGLFEFQERQTELALEEALEREEHKGVGSKKEQEKEEEEEEKEEERQKEREKEKEEERQKEREKEKEEERQKERQTEREK